MTTYVTDLKAYVRHIVQTYVGSAKSREGGYPVTVCTKPGVYRVTIDGADDVLPVCTDCAAGRTVDEGKRLEKEQKRTAAQARARSGRRRS